MTILIVPSTECQDKLSIDWLEDEEVPEQEKIRLTDWLTLLSPIAKKMRKMGKIPDLTDTCTGTFSNCGSIKQEALTGAMSLILT